MKIVADRYADALADVALAQNAASQVRRELADFLALMRESPELRVLLENPAVPRASKRGVIEALAARLGASPVMRNFLLVVLDRRRIALLGEIEAAFAEKLDQRQGITRADVTTARALDDAERQRLCGVLEQITGKHVEPEYRLDAGLIAGAVVRIGSTIYDGSVRAQLERLRAQLISR